METQIGKITEVIFRNNENGYTVAEFETETELFTIVGNLARCNTGTRMELTGRFKEHPKYGEQFSISQFRELMPEGTQAIREFLKSGVIKGIGDKYADDIVDRFGDKSLLVIEESPKRLMEIKGIGPKKAAMIENSFAEHREFANISLALQEMGIGSGEAFRIFKIFGGETVEKIRENPYILASEIKGVSFARADKIAENAGIDRESPFRIRSAIEYWLWQHSYEGNTYAPKDLFMDNLRQILDIAPEKIEENMVDMIMDGKIMQDTIDQVPAVYLSSFYSSERHVAYLISQLRNTEKPIMTVDTESVIMSVEKEAEIKFSNEQKEGILSAVNNGMAVITGGPGTGKTTIINALIKIFDCNGFKTEICAPTGRAAKRITETSGHEASTVHRLLEYYYSETEDAMFFGRNADNPLDCHALIVDEASMMDLMLTEALLDALKPETRLIIAGDSDQLPSVGAGNVLRDIIHSGLVHTVKLKEIFRQAGESMIVVNAHRINSGEYPYLNQKGSDFFFMERHREDDMADLVTELASGRLSAYYEGLDSKTDIQVLTPVRKGSLGTASLNERLQQALNPPAEHKAEKKHGGRIFREGDKVMQIKNNYELGWISDDGSEGQGIFNGDSGIVEEINLMSKKIMILFDGEKHVIYDFSQLEELEPAYAITVHKSQGNEFPAVVMPVSWFPPMLATRNLLYTAITRGKSLVVLVGSPERMGAMISNNRIKLRYSGLGSRLSQYFQNPITGEELLIEN